MQVCDADIISALSSTPTRLYADTWAVALTYYCRYIKQTVSICNLLRTPPQIGNGLRSRRLGFALARSTIIARSGSLALRLGKLRWALRLLPSVDPAGYTTTLAKSRHDALATKRNHLMVGKCVVVTLLGPKLSSGSGSLARSCCWS